MSKTKRYIEEQLEKGVDILHPEWLNTQLDDSYEQYYMDQNEERKTNDWLTGEADIVISKWP